MNNIIIHQSLMDSLLTVIVPTFTFLLLLYYFFSKSNTKKQPPVASGAWPVLGHLHLLAGTSKPAYKFFGALADKYGATFMIKLGVHRALIANTAEVAKELFTKNDKIFASRPASLSSDIIGYNYAMFAISEYGPYWRELRKIATVELLSVQRIEMLKNVREDEVRISMKDTYDRSMENENKKFMVEMKKWFSDMNLNMICRLIAGKRCYGEAKTKKDIEEYERCSRGLTRTLELANAFSISDALPFLRPFDIGGTERRMKEGARELDIVLQGWLDEHKEKRAKAVNVETNNDFMDVMLSVCKEDTINYTKHDKDTIVKATCLNLVLGGSETTTVALTWALSALLNNQETLRKAQMELDTVVGKERRLEESDLQHLVYLQAIFKETLRLFPPSTLDAAHMSTEDCEVDGYHIPSGTLLFVNIAKIHRNPIAWPNPDEFQPERFLTTHKHIDFRGQHFDLIPFGGGRRMCPGISLANKTVLLILGNLLHGFDVSSADGKPIDMTEELGFTLVKAKPLEVLLSPRLPSHLYG